MGTTTVANIKVVLSGLSDNTEIRWCGRMVRVGEVRQAIKGMLDGQVVYTERLFPIKEALQCPVCGYAPHLRSMR